jgi:hypothetical protein
VTVNQCNGSGNGGGATVTCRTGLTTNITAPAPVQTATPAPGATGGTGGSGTDSGTDDGGGGAGSGGGFTSGGSGTSGPGPITPGAPGETTGQVVRVPVGGAAAGGGSTSGIENGYLLLLGLILLSAAGPALVLRRRSLVKH